MNSMSNKYIAAQFELLAQLLELSGENPFKVKSYSIAAFRIGKFALPLAGMSEEEIRKLENIGPAVASKIYEITSTGKMQMLEELLSVTPPGIIEMLQLKGLGAKKIRQLWLELEIESIGELAYACQENRLVSLKGFGKKTQDNILKQIEFIQESKGKFLLAQVIDPVQSLVKDLQLQNPQYSFELLGDIARRNNVVSRIEIASDCPREQILEFFKGVEGTVYSDQGEETQVSIPGMSTIYFVELPKENRGTFLFRRRADPSFVDTLESEFSIPDVETEEEVFTQLSLPYLAPEKRESYNFHVLKSRNTIGYIEEQDIKGLIHCHSTWSDGANTIREMAEECIRLGLEYMVISDHSVSAFYANGLTTERIIEQHLEIDQLNKELAPFKIYKSIEADILYSGDIDYTEDVWKRFDLIIASVHSTLRMDEDTATRRILKALDNPYVRILGHPTGRLLLSRAGYPLDMEAVLKKCAERKIVVEINANPRRLDLDVSWINRALELGVMLSINPDAHSIQGISDIRYGVLSASKSMLSPHQNLSSMNKEQLERFVAGA